MNIYQKHINKKSKMCEEMYNQQRITKDLKPTIFKEWRIVNRGIVRMLKKDFNLDNKASLLQFRKYVRKEYNAYKQATFVFGEG